VPCDARKGFRSGCRAAQSLRHSLRSRQRTFLESLPGPECSQRMPLQMRRVSRAGVPIRPSRSGFSPLQRMIVRTAASTSARSGLPSWCEFRTGSKARTLELILLYLPLADAERRRLLGRWQLRDDFVGDRRLVDGKSKPPHHCLSQALAAPTGEGKGIRQYRPNFVF
jgi:hypothetical protein